MENDISWISAIYHSRMGIAQSQVLLGTWTVEFANQKEQQYRDEYFDALKKLYRKARSI